MIACGQHGLGLFLGIVCLQLIGLGEAVSEQTAEAGAPIGVRRTLASDAPSKPDDAPNTAASGRLKIHISLSGGKQIYRGASPRCFALTNMNPVPIKDQDKVIHMLVSVFL